MSFHLSVIEEADALLIEKVRQTSILYNNHYADYRHSHKKDKAWEEVASSLGITKTDAKRRWTCLRDRYSRELKELRSKCPRKEDCGTGEFFQIMDFLRPFVRKRRPNKPKIEEMMKSDKNMIKKMKLDELDTDFQSEECTQDQYEKDNPDDYSYIACEYPIETYEEFTEVQESPIDTLSVDDQCTTKKNKNSLIPIIFPAGTIDTASLETQQAQSEQMQQQQQQVLPQTSQQLHEVETNFIKHQQQKETEDDFFCKSVAIYLRKLSRLHKIKAKVEMFQILEKYIELEENSTIMSS